MNWTKVMWVTVAALGFSVAACGGGDKEKPAASAEPAKTEAAPPPPPAATSAAPAAPPAEPSGAPSGEAEPEPSGSAHAGKHHGKHGAKEGGGEKAEKVIKLERVHLEMNHPGAGWVEGKKGKWVFFRTADKTAILAYVEFEKAGQATKHIQQIAQNLELTDIKWHGNPEKKAVGPDHLKAEYAQGTCKVASNKHECEIEYYTVEGELLIVYAAEVDTKKAGKHERIASKSVETLRRIGK